MAQQISTPPADLARQAFDAWAPTQKGVTRVALLKAIEAETAAVYEREVLSKEPSDEMRKQLRAVVLESNLAGLEEFGERWYTCVKSKMVRMQLCAEFVALACSDDACGFDAYERALVVGAARLLPAYNQYYFDFLHAVQDEKVGEVLKASPPAADADDILSSYMVVSCDGAQLSAAPFATHFAKCLGPVLAGFDTWLAECREAESALAAPGAASMPPWDAPARAAYTGFLQQYRDALALVAGPEALEKAWNDLDRRWMECQMPIQIVHDIETGYGDPLRVKATPDMSLRFLDEAYAAENATIADIQKRMEAWYRARGTPLATAGLKALSNTFAGIYFIPFKTGISLQFSFSGQSIPNRRDVAEEMGIKIYFDPVETAARVRINKALVAKCYHDSEGPEGVITVFKPDAVEQLVWHVAAHEVGHAIYNLRAVGSVFSSPAHESLLEEPRAELTAMWTIRLLGEQGVLSRPKLDEALAHFALDALRYFDKYDSAALRPYIIFQVYAYKVYAKHGYLSLHPTSGRLVLDATKSLAVLDEFVGCFERLLGCMDARDGTGLEKMLFEEMAPEDDFVRSVVALVRAGTPAADAPRPERGCSCHPSWLAVPKAFCLPVPPEYSTSCQPVKVQKNSL